MTTGSARLRSYRNPFARTAGDRINVKDFDAAGNGQHSTVGSDDTGAFNAALAAVKAIQVNIQTTDTPAAEAFMGSQPALYIPAGIYDISGEITASINTLTIIAESGAIIRQNNAAMRIFVLTGAYDVVVKGLRTFGGTRHYDLRNANINLTRFVLDGVECQKATDWAIYTEGTTAPRSSIGTITVANGSQVFTGAGTALLSADVGTYIRIYESATVYTIYRIATLNVGGQTGTLERPYVKAGGAGKSYDVGDFHMSAAFEMRDCKFAGNARVAHSMCDAMELSGKTWVQFDQHTAVSNTAQFLALGEVLDLSGLFGVPSVGTLGDDRLTGCRWVDLSKGSLIARKARFGGESSGIPIVYNFAPYLDAFPFMFGSSIVLEGNPEFFCGPSAATTADKGAIHIRTALGIPQFVSVKGNLGQSGTPIIQNSNAIDIAAFFAGVIVAAAAIEKLFRYDLGPNYTSSDTTQIPTQMLRFTGVLFGTAVLSWGDMPNNTSQTKTITVTGAQPGDPVTVSIGGAILLTYIVQIIAEVTAADTVTIRMINTSGAAQNVSGAGAVAAFATLRKKNWFVDA